MTRLNSAFVLRRTSERLTAGAAAIAATCLMLATVQVRAAEPQADTPRISVSYQDIDFATAKGTAHIYRKLQTAANKVCGVAVGAKLTLEQRTKARECADEALADAVQRINRPMLTSAHEASARKVS